MPTRSGTADLPLHGGRVPQWLASRMAALGGTIIEILVEEYGRKQTLSRLSDPYWFQAFGCVLGMDWHSSGITTSIIGALKRGLAPRARHLGIHVCGGRGRHSRKTPEELIRIADSTGLDGSRLVRSSRLVAKVDNNAVQDGFQIYLHGFVLSDDGDWVVIQQGMDPRLGWARRYHWRSDRVRSFVEEPHEAVIGKNRGTIVNLTDRRAQDARDTLVEMTRLPPTRIIGELKGLRHLDLPRHHDVRPTDTLLRRLGNTLKAARDRGPGNLEELLLVRGVGPKTIAALTLLSELVHGAPASFRDPARFAYAHGGKDGHPFPVRREVYDHNVQTLREALRRASLGHREKLEAFRRLDGFVRQPSVSS